VFLPARGFLREAVMSRTLRRAAAQTGSEEEPMEYRSRNDLADIAQVMPPAKLQMTRTERLLQWAAALDRMAGQPVQALFRLEFLDPRSRSSVRDDNSPISVAWKDPMLQAEGLDGDTVGDAQSFFELTDDQLHYLLCDCHFHGTMTASMVAARLRNMAQHYPSMC
jgi:hypothetical protein